ncbi:uncharacterized protein LOC141884771 isoform X1 [Acropora palmata]|uniref:uncharacterized protein LOC141884771 isoform X1 n=1 Tax=Acropora palmata TaxID=6131 RepID=UPI003DA0927E
MAVKAFLQLLALFVLLIDFSERCSGHNSKWRCLYVSCGKREENKGDSPVLDDKSFRQTLLSAKRNTFFGDKLQRGSKPKGEDFKAFDYQGEE